MKKILLTVVCCLILSQTAYALVMYDTFSLGTRVEGVSHPVGAFIENDDNYDQAMHFILNDNYSLSEVKFGAVSYSDSQTDKTSFAIFDAFILDNVGGLPGSNIIESFHFEGEIATSNPFGAETIVDLSSINNPLLAANTPYWLLVSTPSNQFRLGLTMNRDLTESQIAAYRRNEFSNWQQSLKGPAFGDETTPFTGWPNRFQLVGSSENPGTFPVPEPASFALFGAGFLGTFFRRRL